MTTAHSGTRSEINVTPLIDVLLVLLIIFMVITPLVPKGLPSAVPQPASSSTEISEPAVVLELRADGSLRLNTHLLEPEELQMEVSQIFASRANKVLFLKADQQLEYRQVARLLDAVRGVNPAIEVGLLTPRSETK